MRVLITGASGLLGGKLARMASNSRLEVFGTYRSQPVTIKNPVHLDVTEKSAVLAICSKIHPDVIINAAALTDVDLCEREKDLALVVNAEAVGYLAEVSRVIGAHLVQLSTDYIFDGEKGMYTEGDEPNPINHYGYSKLLGEKKVLSMAESWCIARSSVIFGWGREQRPNFATWVLKSLRVGQKLSVITDQYASPTLNNNLVAMLLEIAERKLQGIYHVAGRDRINRFEMAVKIAEIFNLDGTLLSPSNSSSTRWLVKNQMKNKSQHLQNKITRTLSSRSKYYL